MPHPTQTRYVLSFYRVRQALGILGLAFPFLLLFGGLLQDGKIHPSVSDYYHTTLRDLYVGALFAIGIFLISYQGHSRKTGEPLSDNLAATLAGVGAFGLALFPNQMLDGPRNIFEFYLQDNTKWGHFLAAVLFLGSMAYFSLFKFARTRNRKRRAIYRACGWAIIVFGLGATFFSILRALRNLGLTDPVETSGVIFWCEALGIWAFGISWLVKGKADLLLVRRWRASRRMRD